jgi:hypothetical protein
VLISNKNIHTTLITFLLLALSHLSVAQLQRLTAGNPAPEKTVPQRQSASARTQSTDTLLLPFFDDFSYNQTFADTLLWQNSFSVSINDGAGIHPPTINVATFDALKASGAAYNPNDVLLTGYADTLLSMPIDLSPSAISPSEKPTVFLSFFYQWAGNGEAPDAKDFLQLDFRTAAENEWKTVMTIYPEEDPDPTLFNDTIIQVSGDEFFHKGFQFRFRSFGRLSGPFDTWHVDYVYLNKNRDINNLSFPDRAISTQLGPLFGVYRAIPRKHFFSNEQMAAPTYEVQNMKNEAASINFRTEGFFSSTDFRETDTVTTTYATVISESTSINYPDDNNVILAKEHKTVNLGVLPDISNTLQFPTDPGIDSTLIRLTLALQTRDDIPFNKTPPVEPDSTGDYTPNYEPIRFTTNDTVSADYVLSTYYAYDDGVAEYAAGLLESGNLVAYQFEMEIDSTTALKQDTLVAIDIYFPPYAVTSNQTVDFFIYHDDEGLPGNLWLRIPSKRVARKGVNQFQRIKFLPALLIDEKTFYIGWMEPASGEVVVGLDISNDTGDKIFVNTDGTWYQNEDVKGSLMFRPIFGSGIVDANVGVEEEAPFAIYPNPTKGIFYIDGVVTDLEIQSLTGQPISFDSVTHDQRTEVKIKSDRAGLYILRYKQGTAYRAHKIIIAP